MSDETPQTGTRSPSPLFKAGVAGMVLLGVLIVGSLAALAMSRIGQSAPMRPLAVFEGVVVPDFSGVDQRGETVTGEALDGHVTLVDFFFTNCPLICPEMSTRMMELAQQLEGTDVQFLSISVDPTHDTPERLAEFAARYQAEAPRWRFVRTDAQTLEHVASTIGFALQTSDDVIPVSDGSSMANIIHPTSMLLIGPDRNIYGRYYYRSEDELAQAAVDARRLSEQ